MNHVVCHLIHAKIIFIKQIGKVCQVHNSVIFSEKHIEHEEFFNQMVEALGIIIDRHPRGKPHKRES